VARVPFEITPGRGEMARVTAASSIPVPEDWTARALARLRTAMGGPATAQGEPLPGAPRVAVVCGSGIGAALPTALHLQVDGQIALAELGLPSPQVQGHGQALVWGRCHGVPVILQTGRLHPYEGHPMEVVMAALRAMLAVLAPQGDRAVVLTSAVGGLRADLEPGQIVSLRDQIGLWGPTPLVGPRFVDCSRLYAPSLRVRLQAAAAARGAHLAEAVYAHTRGPQYESPAETEVLRRLGADVVGMSTTYEAIEVAAQGLPCCGLSIVTNVAGAVGLHHDEVQQRSAAALSQLAGLVRGLIAGSVHARDVAP
jgi:purine-nucleoside phosphorylase